MTELVPCPKCWTPGPSPNGVVQDGNGRTTVCWVCNGRGYITPCDPHEWREAPSGEMVCRACKVIADEYAAPVAGPQRINEQLYAWLERRAIREQM